MTPTLLVLAAGMGSRYGGLKQLDPFGPNGETIIDYSVYDAARAGFGKVVFVIRRDFADEFREKVSDKYKNRIEVRTVFQGLENIPEGYTLHPERKKPLGTGHAVWCASKEISEPFAVINADDFYGPTAFRIMAEHLSTLDDCSQKEQTMVGYKLTNTLSENGSVSRGVCEIEEPGCTLKSITERTKIYRTENGNVVYRENDVEYPLTGDEIVSMNMMGFTSCAFEHFEKGLHEFLRENSSELKKEFYLPTVLNNMIHGGYSVVKVLKTSEQWFGVTYPEDKPSVMAAIRSLVNTGVYPSPLW